MKSAIKAVIAVAMLAGVAGATELVPNNTMSVEEIGALLSGTQTVGQCRVTSLNTTLSPEDGGSISNGISITVVKDNTVLSAIFDKPALVVYSEDGMRLRLSGKMNGLYNEAYLVVKGREVTALKMTVLKIADGGQAEIAGQLVCK